MVVSVTASTTQGSNLNEAELEVVVECADVAVKLTDYKKKIFEYVEIYPLNLTKEQRDYS